MFEKNKEKMKEKMEPDKVLRFAIVAVILLFLIGALIIGTRMMNPRVDATEGVKKLTELEDANVQKIDAKIQELEQTEADEAAAWKAKSAKEKMDGCIVLGDSTALGFRQNDILSKSQVKSKDGAMVSDAEGSGLNELLTAVTEADTAPQKLILCIGAVSGETADTFAANYKSFVEQVKAALPDTKVYVCSIPAYQSLTSTGDATGSADSDTDSDSDSDAKDTTDNSDSKSSTDSKSNIDSKSSTDSKSNIDSKSSTDSKSNSDTSSDDSSSSKMSTVLDVTSYNEALKTLCKEEKVKYVDTTDLTDASYYGEDGSTMTKAYYEACINKILEAAFRNYVIQ